MLNPLGRPTTRGTVWPGLAAALVVAAVSVSCGGSDSTSPPDLTCETETVSLCSNAAARVAAQDGLADAVSRSTPALENAAGRATIATRLGQLHAAIVAGNITGARAALTSSREGVASARAQLGTYPGDAADLASIDLILDQVAPLLGV